MSNFGTKQAENGQTLCLKLAKCAYWNRLFFSLNHIECQTRSLSRCQGPRTITCGRMVSNKATKNEPDSRPKNETKQKSCNNLSLRVQNACPGNKNVQAIAHISRYTAPIGKKTFHRCVPLAGAAMRVWLLSGISAYSLLYRPKAKLQGFACRQLVSLHRRTRYVHIIRAHLVRDTTLFLFYTLLRGRGTLMVCFGDTASTGPTIAGAFRTYNRSFLPRMQFRASHPFSKSHSSSCEIENL